jgi:hypothetical protein
LFSLQYGLLIESYLSRERTYSWFKDLMEAGKGGLKEDSLRDATQIEVKELK